MELILLSLVCVGVIYLFKKKIRNPQVKWMITLILCFFPVILAVIRSIINGNFGILLIFGFHFYMIKIIHSIVYYFWNQSKGILNFGIMVCSIILCVVFFFITLRTHVNETSYYPIIVSITIAWLFIEFLSTFYKIREK